MDYLDPEKRRKHTQRLFIGYGLMAVLIVLGTIILSLLAFGYSFDRRTGTVIQNGLLFVDTNPIDAEVYINDDSQGSGSQRLVLPAGEYTIDIREDGYRSWHKDIRLAGGSVERFAYPFLFPEELTRSQYRSFNTEPELITTSPDRRWMLIQEADQLDAFVLYDLRQQINLPSFFSLPVGVMNSTAEGSTLELIEWSNNNRHLIVKHTHDTGEEYVLIDRDEPGNSQNLTARFSDTAFTDISLLDKQFDEYHLFNRETGELYVAELGEDTAELLLSNVITYRTHGSERILYVSSEPLNVTAEPNEDTEDYRGVYIYQDAESTRIANTPAGTVSDYLLDLARFDGSWYVVIGNRNENRANVYQEPLDNLTEDDDTARSDSTLYTDSTPERVTFSGNARNIMMQAGNQFAVYDLEREQSYRYEFGSDSISPAYWMDGHRILAIWDDTLYVTDFDGENRHELVTCHADKRPLFDTSYEYLYCVEPDDEDNTVFGRLVRLSLLAKDD